MVESHFDITWMHLMVHFQPSVRYSISRKKNYLNHDLHELVYLLKNTLCKCRDFEKVEKLTLQTCIVSQSLKIMFKREQGTMV